MAEHEEFDHFADLDDIDGDDDYQDMVDLDFFQNIQQEDEFKIENDDDDEMINNMPVVLNETTVCNCTYKNLFIYLFFFVM